MKTFVYIKERKDKYVVTAAGRCPDNCDAVAAIGRPHTADEIVGIGVNKKEAVRDAMCVAYWQKKTELNKKRGTL